MIHCTADIQNPFGEMYSNTFPQILMRVVAFGYHWWLFAFGDLIHYTSQADSRIFSQKNVSNRVCRHRLSSRRSCRFASDNSLLYHADLDRMII